MYVFIQHTNNKTGIGRTTGFADGLSIMWSTSKVTGYQAMCAKL